MAAPGFAPPASAYQAPGVYLRLRRTDLPDVRRVRTDVAGFVGYAERGILPPPPGPWKAEDVAIRLTSWEEYRARFGGLIPNGYLPYAVRGFFENGGSTCYVVRVARPGEARAAVWALPAGPPVAVGRVTRDTAPGDVLVTDIAQATFIGVSGILELDGGGGLPKRYVVRSVSPAAEVELAGTLDRAVRAGTVVRLYAAGLRLEATTPGRWGNRIRIDVRPLGTASDFSLRIALAPGADPSQPREEEFYRRVSLAPGDPAYVAQTVNARSRLVRVVVPAEDADRTPATPGAAPAAPVATRAPFVGGLDGIARVGAADFTGGLDDRRGLQLLEEIDEVAILCVPDAVFDMPVVLAPAPHTPAPCDPPDDAEPSPALTPEAVPPALGGGGLAEIQLAMLRQCERRRDRIAVLDAPVDVRGVHRLAGFANQTLQLAGRASRFGALYAPWLQVADPVQGAAGRRTVPPSGYVAGVYARTDATLGVHHPPANALLEGVTDAVDEISALEQEDLNPAGVNVIRVFQGRGIRVYGARTLAPKDDGYWRFVNVRRLMSMIEESVDVSMQWAVFESHDDALRRTLVHSLSVFLRGLWRQGALRGNTPAEAFFVKCDDTNNPQAAVDAGQLVCEVGVAPAAPLEFLVFELRQRPEGAELHEQ